MGKFIEVTPFEDGKDQPKMLISTDKIDYVLEENKYISSIYLKDIPLGEYTKKPRFDNPIYVNEPFIFLTDKIMKMKEVE